MRMTQLIGAEAAGKKFQALSLAMQSKLLRGVADTIIVNSQRRIATQTDLTGARFKANRANAEKKMLLGLSRALTVLSVSNTEAVIGFSGNVGVVATAQQEGETSTVTARHKGANLSAPATARQAVELVQLGFKLNKYKPTTSEIMAKYTIGQAAGILAKLRANAGIETKKTWQVTIPARSFLGVTHADQQELLAIVTDNLTTA